MTIWFFGGVAVGFAAAVLFTRWRSSAAAPSEATVTSFADAVDEIERAWKPAGVGLGYSLTMETGECDVTIRVANVGEDVTFRLASPNVRRVRRTIGDTLKITTELPPSLGGGQQIGGDG
jgi:hypothetical protein